MGHAIFTEPDILSSVVLGDDLLPPFFMASRFRVMARSIDPSQALRIMLSISFTVAERLLFAFGLVRRFLQEWM